MLLYCQNIAFIYSLDVNFSIDQDPDLLSRIVSLSIKKIEMFLLTLGFSLDLFCLSDGLKNLKKMFLYRSTLKNYSLLIFSSVKSNLTVYQSTIKASHIIGFVLDHNLLSWFFYEMIS
jgi:hypothetical protein